MRLATLLALLWLAAPGGAAAQTRSGEPGPVEPRSAELTPADLSRPSGCVLDRTGTLSPSAVEAIETECGSVAAAGHELAVVVISTAGPRGPAQFALDLFNDWHVGGPGDSDGVLLFAALDDRAAEITLGDDLDTPANSARSDRVMSEVIVPAFRRGSPERAMQNGARYAAANLFSAGPGAFVTPARGDASATLPSNRPQMDPPRVSTAFETSSRAPARRSEPPGLSARAKGALGGYGLWLVLGVLGIVFLIGLWFFLRYRRRKCDECGSPMIRFDEVEDDKHLTSGKQKEEDVGSVDYDVWACMSCDHLIERRYAAWFSRYRKCDGCGARTRSSVSRTVRSATEHSTGLAEITVSCAHCARTSTHTRVIPRIPPPSDNNNSSGGGGSQSFGGGGGGYSGGGGGSSSGGGSSGRW